MFNAYKSEMGTTLAGTVIKEFYSDMFNSYEDGLKVGVFGEVVAGELKNITSASTVAHGLVRRITTNTLEAGETYAAGDFSQIEMLREGSAVAKVKTGDTPARYDACYVEKDTAGQEGRATTDNTQLAIKCEFVEQVGTDTWVIRFKF